MSNAKENEANVIKYDNSYNVLLLEAFYGGSHKQLIDTLLKSVYINLRAQRYFFLNNIYYL